MRFASSLILLGSALFHFGVASVAQAQVTAPDGGLGFAPVVSAQDHQLNRSGWLGQATGVSQIDATRAQTRPAATLTAHNILGHDKDHHGGSCDSCDLLDCCSRTNHRTGFFGEVLILRPGNTDVLYAVEMTGTDPVNDSPTGPTGIAKLNSEMGFRAGMNWALCEDSSVVATYTFLESDRSSQLIRSGGNVLLSMVADPSLANVGTGSVQADALYDLNLQMVDLDYRHMFWGDCQSSLNYTIGVRYAHYDTQFSAAQNIFAGAGLTTVATDITFDGVGIRFGLDGERHSNNTGIFLFSKAYANFVAGDFRATYRQTNQFGGAAVIGNNFEDYRLISILEAEIGIGWQSADGRWRLQSGYMVAGWFNALTTGSYIAGHRARSYDDMSETMTLDGATARVTFSF